jgi:DNA repair exonuclease SbcCD ATPase subunit
MITTTLSHIEFSLSDLRSRYNQALGQKEMLERQKSEKQEALIQAKKDIELWQQVQVLFGKVSEFARAQLKARIEETVTAALQAVFERDDMAFEIEMRTVNNQPAANWQVVSYYGAGEDISTVSGSPEDARGGGISDVVSLALRLALLELARPKPRGPVLLDEVGKHVSKEYAPNVAQFLKQYAQKTGRQILLITHQSDLADVADVSYRVSQENGVSEVQHYV